MKTEIDNILTKWLMEDHTGEEVSVKEMYKVRLYIDDLQAQLAAHRFIPVSERLPEEPKAFKYIDELRTYPVWLKERTMDKGWRKARYTGKGSWHIEGCHGDWTVIEWFDLPLPDKEKSDD